MSRWTSSRWHAVDVAGLLAVVGLLAGFWWSRVLTGASVMKFAAVDLFLYCVPAYARVAEALREWRTPLWNPHQACGVPFLGVLQAGYFYPARWLLLVLDPSAALGWSTLLHLGIAAVGPFMLARALGSGTVGAVVASVGFTYGFAAVGIYAPSTLLESGVWLPVAAYALLRMTATMRWRYACLATFAIAAPILAGGHQIALYSFYGLGLFGIALVVDRRYRSAILAPKTLALVLAVCSLAIALSAVQWAPTLFWARHGERSTEPLSAAEIDPWKTPPTAVAAASVSRQTDVGGIVLPAPLAVLAILGTLFGPRLVLPLFIGGLIAFLLSLGPGAPWFSLYHWLPGFSMFRAPARLGYLVVFLASVAAAFGVESLCRAARPAGPIRGALASAAVLGALVVVIRAPVPSPPRADFYDLLAVGGTLGSVLLPPPLVGPAALAQVLATAVGVRANDSLLPYSSPKGDRLIARHHGTYRNLAARAGLSRVAFATRPVFEVPTTPKQAMLTGLYAADDYEPLHAERTSEYFSLLTRGHVASRADGIALIGVLPLTEPPVSPRLLDMMSVRYLVGPRPETLVDPPIAALVALYRMVPSLVPQGEPKDLVVLENAAALPRAYTVGGVRPVTSDVDATRAILDPGFDPRREVVAGANLISRPPSAPLREAEIVSYQPERVVIRARAETDGALVLTDTYAEGWTATLDGMPVPIWPANYLFRGITLPPGDHQVVFEYMAPGYRAGRVASLLALLTLVGVPIFKRAFFKDPAD